MKAAGRSNTVLPNALVALIEELAKRKDSHRVYIKRGDQPCNCAEAH